MGVREVIYSLVDGHGRDQTRESRLLRAKAIAYMELYGFPIFQRSPVDP